MKRIILEKENEEITVTIEVVDVNGNCLKKRTYTKISLFSINNIEDFIKTRCNSVNRIGLRNHNWEYNALIGKIF